jgi:hypothetical protein
VRDFRDCTGSLSAAGAKVHSPHEHNRLQGANMFSRRRMSSKKDRAYRAQRCYAGVHILHALVDMECVAVLVDEKERASMSCLTRLTN